MMPDNTPPRHLLVLFAALFACHALGAPSTEQEHVSPFIQPLPSAVFALLNVAEVSVGVDVPMRSNLLLVAEGLFATTQNDPFAKPVPYTRVVLAVGVAFFHPSGPGPLQGAFLEPKLNLEGRRFRAGQEYFGGSAGVDLDLGYRWRSGPLTLSFVTGLGLSYVLNSPYPLLQMAYVEPPPAPVQGWSLDINLNLLRLGFTL